MRVGVVGLGKMGSALARRLLAEGIDVVVWNRTSAPVASLVEEAASGAQVVQVAGSLSSIWQDCSRLCTFLADDAAVLGVCLGEGGLLASAPAGALLVEMSTISPKASRAVAEAASAAAVRYLRCPVSGNPGVLSAGDLTLFVSGAADDLADAGFLGSIARDVMLVGGAEEARTIKLAVNAMLAATTEALAESVLLCESAGVERSVALEAIVRSAVGSPFVRYKRPQLLERRYEATFTTAMLQKDLRLALEVGEETNVDLPLALLVAELSKDACDLGLGDLDFLALLPRLQHLAGRPTDVPVGPDPERSRR